jgi:hypothetical protein
MNHYNSPFGGSTIISHGRIVITTSKSGPGITLQSPYSQEIQLHAAQNKYFLPTLTVELKFGVTCDKGTFIFQELNSRASADYDEEKDVHGRPNELPYEHRHINVEPLPLNTGSPSRLSILKTCTRTCLCHHSRHCQRSQNIVSEVLPSKLINVSVPGQPLLAL